MTTQVIPAQYAVPDEYLIPISDYPRHVMSVPTSRMFVLKRALDIYLKTAGDGAQIYDASQGDGGQSLPGVPGHLLERAFQLQCEVGTGYDTPSGHPRFRKAMVEQYWKLDTETGWGTANVLAAQGGRDALMKAYSAMVYCGNQRFGDVIITSAVPWISYNWGPYAGGLNVLRAPGDPAEAWAYTEKGLEETVNFAKQTGRHPVGILITSPDNPTGRTLSLDNQITLAQKALSLGVSYVLFDWIYHWVTEGEPHDINVVLKAFSSETRNRLMFLDGLTKSIGASNVRVAHLMASKEVVDFITSHASHGVIPSFYSQAVAIAACEMGFREACRPIVEPTNASRHVVRKILDENGYEYIMGDGYYAFLNVEKWVKAQGWEDTEELGRVLAEQFGVAIVPGVYFSPAAKYWIRLSYALPPEKTAATFARLQEGLNHLA